VQVGVWINLIFDVMMVAGVVSAALAMAMLIDTAILPLDWGMAVFYPDTMPAFIASSMGNAAQVMRLRLGQLYIVAASLGWIYSTFNRDTAWYHIYFGGLTLIVIWLIGASHAHEFYTILPEAERKAWSFDYARLFVFNLALPILFWFLFATGQQAGFVDYAGRHLFGAQPSALFVLERDSSTCDVVLERAGLRARHNDLNAVDGVLDPMPWIDEYLRGVTFGIPDAFGCTFNDIQINAGNRAMWVAVTLFRTIVSFFSISVLLLPLQHLFRLLARAARKPD
jgi:hypothetical protein